MSNDTIIHSNTLLPFFCVFRLFIFFLFFQEINNFPSVLPFILHVAFLHSLPVSTLYPLESESESCSVMSDSLQPHGLYSPWNSPGQNTGVSSLSLLQGIFPTQGFEPRSPVLQADSLPTEPQGKFRISNIKSQNIHGYLFKKDPLENNLRPGCCSVFL